jgi:Short C-terminal domain
MSHAETLTLKSVSSITLDSATQWQSIHAPPGNPKGLFLLSSSGDLYTLPAGDIEPSLMLSLNQISTTATKITAIALHPSFSLRDQAGYHTFYSAHIEPIDSNRRRTRLQNADVILTFDMVITEWQMLNKTVDLDSQREIIRIGVPSEQSYINQLAFSPLSKVWNDDFGLLYIGLRADEQHKNLPLYSGAILRIDPKKFGLRTYTVPPSNPFLTHDEIDNELLVIGLQHLMRFIWPDKNDSHLLVQHRYEKQNNLTLVKPSGDYRKTKPKQILYSTTDTFLADSLLSYRGRSLAHLWGSTLFVIKSGEQNQLHSLFMPDSTGNIRSPALEWQSRSSIAPEQIALYQYANQEVLVFNKTQQQLYQLSPVAYAGTEPADNLMNNNQEQSQTNSNTLLFIFICIGLGLIGLFWIHNKASRSGRNILKQQLTGIEIDESNQHILLYRRHEKTAEYTIPIVNIVESKLILNDVELSCINSEIPFSNNDETNLREQFRKEKREKMMSGRVRKVTLTLVDNEHHEYLICVYVRKGDNRITREKFTDVIEHIMDWYWLFSSAIAPEQTEKRQSKTANQHEHMAPISSLFQPQSSTLKQVELAKPLNPKNTVDSNQSSPKEDIPAQTDKGNVKVVHSDESNARVKADSDLVIALEKLAQLKQQGMLTEQEYQRAKQKILADLLT